MDLEIFKLVWNAVLTGVILILGWLWNTINKRLEDIDERHAKNIGSNIEAQSKITESILLAHSKMQDTLTQIQINYVHKDELRNIRTELLDRFDRLEDLVTKRNKE